MKSCIIAAAVLMSLSAGGALAQNSTSKPKNEINKLDKARHTDRTTRQVTPSPKKSPAKHAKNLSKNVNHELNRESKNINHALQGKKK